MSDTAITKPENKIVGWASGKPMKIEELYADIEEQALQSHLTVILNHPPKKEWIQKHPTAKINGQPVEYLPIDRLEWMLHYFFADWRVEVKDWKLFANSASVSVRVHYKHPISGVWSYTDGLGAAPLQTDAGAGAIEFDKIKNNAVQIGLPAAETFAIKDAVEKLGRIFGRDLNRKNPLDYAVILGTEENPRFTSPEEITEPEL